MTAGAAWESPTRLGLAWSRLDACPLCGADRSEWVSFARWEDVVTLHYWLCRRCGLVFQSPQPSEASLADYYAADYHGRMAAGLDDAARNEWVQDRRAVFLVERLHDWGHRPKLCLDIGSSLGDLMARLQSELGARAVGVEPGDEHRGRARAAGLEVYASLDELPQGLAGQFDLMTLAHVVEHLPHPAESLAALRRRWLSPAGLLVLEVPDLRWHRAFELAHLHAFTPGSVDNLLGAAGFEPGRLLRHGHPYSKRLPYFILAEARAAEEPRKSFVRPSFTAIRLSRLALRAVAEAYQWLARVVRGSAALAPWRGP